MPGYDLRVTVAENHEDVGLDGVEYTSATDSTRHYLRVDYDEEIERTLRFYVHEDVFYPHYRDVDAEESDVTATFTPVEDSEYTAVELTVDGPTDAVVQIPKAVSGYYYARDAGRSWIENRTGIEVPSIFGGAEQWQPVDDADLSGNESVAIGANESEPMIQYDAQNGSGERWVAAPPCDSSEGEAAPVCTYTLPDDDAHVYVTTNVDDPPPVRYKHGTDVVSQLQQSVNGLMEAPDRLQERVEGLIEGVL